MIKRLLLLIALLFVITTPAYGNSLRSELLHIRVVRQQASFERNAAINRIDNYLSGSPLAGLGEVFYDTAQKYGIDYRLSPAISCIESGKGRHLFRSHNAWGWGKINWPNWTQAIEGHIGGIARGYGDISPQAMNRRYCPPNQAWGAKVQSEMNKMGER